MKILLIITLFSFFVHSQAIADSSTNMDLDQVIEKMEKTLGWLPKTDIYQPEIITQGSEPAPATKIESVPVAKEEPVILVRGYKRYNIIFYDETYYGVNMGEGAIDVRSINVAAKMPWVKSKSKEELMILINDLVSSEGDLGDPVLVEEGYNSHNIVLYNDLFYGVHQAEGSIDVRDLKNQAKLPWASAKTLEEVKVNVNEFILKAKYNTPILVQGNYKFYNIVKYKGTFYGISQREGPIDVINIKSAAKYDWFSSENIDKVRAEVDKKHAKESLYLKVRWQLSKFKASLKRLGASILGG